MSKHLKYIRLLTIALGFLLTLFLFLPLYEIEGTKYFAFLVIFGLSNSSFDIFSFITFLLPSIASLLLLVKKKNLELVSFLLFLLSSFAFLFINDFNTYVNKDSLFEIIKSIQIILIVLGFLNVLLTFSIALEKESFKTRDIVEMALFIALAVILDLPGLKIRVGIAGGSISLTMVPLLLFSIRHGLLKGFLASGVIYGFLTNILDGWGFVYYPIDYLLGYGAMSLIGFFKVLILDVNNKRFTIKGALFLVIGALVAIIARLMFATLSGIVYYEYTFWASFVYNVTYLLPSAVIVIAALLILYVPFIRLHFNSLK